MVIRTEKTPALKALPKKNITVAQFKEGQITEYENDKIPFSACSELKNMVLRKLNLETRRGTATIFTDTDTVGISKINTSSEPLLGRFKKKTTTTQLSSINPSDGTETVLVADATGIQSPSWANSSNRFYFTVGNGEINTIDVDGEPRPSSGAVVRFFDSTGTFGTLGIETGRHPLTAESITITGTTNYNGTHTVVAVTADIVYINVAFVADEAGQWSMPVGSTLSLTGVQRIAFSDKRVWAMTGDAVHYSTTNIDSFSDALGTYDATTGRYDNGTTHGGKVSLGGLSNLVEIVADGKLVIVFGRDYLQVHELPDAETVSYIDPDRPTMKYERDYGIESPKSVLVRGGFVYFANSDGFYRLNPRDGQVKSLRKNRTQHQSFDFSGAAMGYDKELSAVLVFCKNNAVNDTVLAYFEDYDAFAYYTNISVLEAVNIEDKLYGYDRTGKFIADLFPEGTWTDNGIPIEYVATTAASDAGVPQYFKKMRELFLDIANDGANTVYLDMFFDRISGGTKPAAVTFPVMWKASPIPFGVYAGSPLGDASLGMSTIINSEGTQEKKLRLKNRAKFGHVEISLRGNTSRRVSWRRFVFEYQELPKKIKTMLLDQ